MAYLYDTHLHTSQGSACGVSRGKDYIQRYLDLGYTGIIVTDHFYRGNCAVNRGNSWDRWVHKFCIGYEDALEEGTRRGLDVFFGWEETFEGDDYLVYGLDKQWLLEHPEVRSWTRKEQLEETRRYGGCVVQAHPFRQYYYIKNIRLSGCVDAVEAANAANDRDFDFFAWTYAKKLKLPVTAGSDAHYVKGLQPETAYGVYLDKMINSIGDYADAVRNNRIAGLKVPEGRFDYHGNEKIELPMDIRNNRDQPIGDNLAGI